MSYSGVPQMDYPREVEVEYQGCKVSMKPFVLMMEEHERKELLRKQVRERIWKQKNLG